MSKFIPIYLKLVVVGDKEERRQKTKLLQAFQARGSQASNFENIEVYNNYVFNNYNEHIIVDKFAVEVSLNDTTGQEEFSELRKLGYELTNTYILVFSVDNRTSFENLEKWYEEVYGYSGSKNSASFVLVGMFGEKRLSTSDKSSLVSADEIAKFCSLRNIAGYVEIHHVEQFRYGVEDAIYLAIRSCLYKDRYKRRIKLETVIREILERQSQTENYDPNSKDTESPRTPKVKIERSLSFVVKKSIVLQSVKSNGYLLIEANEELQKDIDIIIAALEFSFAGCIGLIPEVVFEDKFKVLKIAEKNGRVLELASEELKDDKEVVMQAICTSGGCIFRFASENLKGDRNFVLRVVKESGDALKYAEDFLKEDEEIVMAAVSNNGHALGDAHKKLQNDRSIVLAAVSNCGDAIAYASETLRDDFEIAKVAVEEKGESLRYCSEALRDTDTIVRVAVKNSGESFQYASNRLKNDEGMFLQAVFKDGWKALRHGSEWLRKDEKILLCSLKRDFYEGNSKSFRFVDEKLRNDLEFLLKALEVNEYLKFEKGVESLFRNKAFVLRIIEKNPRNIERVNPELLDVEKEREFIESLIRKNWRVVQYLKDEFVSDRGFVDVGMSVNLETLRYSPKFSRDKEYVEEAVKKNPEVLLYACEVLRKDREFVEKLVSVRRDREVLKYCDVSVVLKEPKDCVEIFKLMYEELIGSEKTDLFEMICDVVIRYNNDFKFFQHNDQRMFFLELIIKSGLFNEVLMETGIFRDLAKEFKGRRIFETECFNRQLYDFITAYWSEISPFFMKEITEDDLFQILGELFDRLVRSFLLPETLNMFGVGKTILIHPMTIELLKPLYTCYGYTLTSKRMFKTKTNLMKVDFPVKQKNGYVFFESCGLGIEFERRTGFMKKPSVKLQYFGGFDMSKKERNGLGREYSSDGIQFYEGEYKFGMKHGRGEMYDHKNHNLIRGYWEVGKLTTPEFKFNCPFVKYRAIEKHLKNSKILGKGGFGIVYEVKSSFLKNLLPGIDLGKKKSLAVKIMDVNNNFELDTLFRTVKRGLELSASLQSNYILDIYGIIKGPRAVGYVMEIGKDSVHDIIRKQDASLTLDKKIQILYETALGIRDLHARLYMHRDLKWANILIGEDGHIRITDFDTLKEDEQWRLRLNFGQTSSIGTQGFIAPEVYTGNSYTLACDIYAFGLMIYSLLFGICFPFSTCRMCQCGKLLEDMVNSNTLDMHVAGCNFRPLLLRNDVKSFPKYLVDLIMLCWHKSPEARPSFSDIVSIFESERRKKKCYNIMRFQFSKHPEIEDQQMFLMKTDHNYHRVREWLEINFEHEVLRIIETSTGQPWFLLNDEDLKKVLKNEVVILDVEFEMKENETLDEKEVEGEDDDEKCEKKKCESCEEMKKRVLLQEKRIRELLEKLERKEVELKNSKIQMEKMVSEKLDKLMNM